VLAGDVKDVLLLDVTPLSLGVETLGGVMTALIPRNTTIPTRKSEIFSTAEDNQGAVDVRVFQGERPMAADNMMLGQFRLDGIPAAPRGLPQVEVTFDIDANGILNVTAKDKATSKEQHISITASTNLNKQDVERMVQEAQRNAAQDQKRKEVVDARNLGDNTLYTAEKALRDLGDKVSGGDRGAVEGALNDLRDALKTDDINRIKKATETVQQTLSRIGAAAYGQGGPNAGPNGQNPANQGGQNGQSGNDEGVVEGEYRQV
jgi:molecular chaperone DnaK